MKNDNEKDSNFTSSTSFKGIYKRHQLKIFAALSGILPFIFYLLTLERKLIGGDTSWYALKIPKMEVFVPTGYPTFSMLSKLFTYLPINDMAYRLNLFSAVFGALTILFLFLAAYRLTRNEPVSLLSSLCFAFVFPFWNIANRLEFDTLNSFFVVLVIFSAVLYQQKLKRSYLYFFFFALGLTLTNHPIAFFIAPAFLIFVIIARPDIFKSVKAVFGSILLFVLPLLSYLYLLIRSLQGFGPVTSFGKLLIYMTGRSVTGIVHGGSFGDKSPEVIWGVIGDYFKIIYDSYGIVLIVVAVIGLGHLFKKNLKLAITSVLAIVLNIAIASLYLSWANPNYCLNILLIMAVFIAFGFLLIIDRAGPLLEKLIQGRKAIKVDKILKIALVTALLCFFAFQPALLVYVNYGRADMSEPQEIYKFWDETFDLAEEDSKIYVLSYAGNVGIFVNKYEYGHKNIEFIYHQDERYSIESIMEDLAAGKTVYFVGNEGPINSYFYGAKVGRTHYFEWYDEPLKLYMVLGERIEVTASCDLLEVDFGKQFMVEYRIKNFIPEELRINSLELELPGGIEFVSVDPAGYIDQGPGISRGIYMWVSDSYIIDGEDEVNIIINLRATSLGEHIVKFRITTGNQYIEVPDITVNVK